MIIITISFHLYFCYLKHEKTKEEKLQKNIKWIIELDKHLKQCVWSF